MTTDNRGTLHAEMKITHKISYFIFWVLFNLEDKVTFQKN